MKKNKGYEFDSEGHYHSYDGKPLMGVTTILKVIAKPMLIPWASKMATEYIKENCTKAGKCYLVTKEDLEKAKNAHNARKKKGGDTGKTVHNAIEEYIKNGIKFKSQAVDPKDRKKEQKMFNNFVKWSKENKVKFLESEKNVYSVKERIGGILDFTFEMGGKRYIGDVKTSSGIYPEHYLQMGAYDLLLQEMGYPKVDGYLVVNIPASGRMRLKLMKNIEENQKAFLHCLGIYKALMKMKWNPYY